MKALKGKSLVGSIVHVTMRQMSSRMKISVQAEGILADVGELLGVRKVSSRRSIGKNLRGNTDTGHRERGARVAHTWATMRAHVYLSSTYGSTK